jgi:hypothetical protein
MVNGVEYLQYYLSVNGMYPKWSIFVSTIGKRCHFEYWQEPCKKDIVFWISK